VEYARVGGHLKTVTPSAAAVRSAVDVITATAGGGTPGVGG